MLLYVFCRCCSTWTFWSSQSEKGMLRRPKAAELLVLLTKSFFYEHFITKFNSLWCQWFQVPIEASIVFLMHWILICLLNSGRGRLVRSLCVLRVLRPPWICPCQLCCTVDSQKLSLLITQARARKGCNLKISAFSSSVWNLSNHSNSSHVKLIIILYHIFLLSLPLFL